MEKIKIDYYQLMDLRIDYAFKLLFTKGDPRLLISLLNAIFANKKIQRVIKSISIKNPFLDRESGDDKLSILDIRAELEDGTAILIEIHMYGLGELKAKTIRSWARAYGEDLEIGNRYTSQPPTIAIAFTNGTVEALENTQKESKIHRLCMIMDCEDFTVFTDAMELHYIDMQAFAKAVNEANSININDTEEAMFVKWLSVITQKEINNKSIIENACKDEEEIYMAVSALSRQSEDKYARQAYQRRQDELYFHNKARAEYEQAKHEIEQVKHEAEQAKHEAEQAKHEAEQAKHEAEQANRIIEQERQKAEQANAQLADKDAIIAELQAKLTGLSN
ncbi:MAG: Rpn family recombination-promoting nuclease/putative transposase [Defluviitaleaceae bacterium]|nr:Rpn family recombination-promoting nuclease/putative transposase [Defluviitaleaceae bacterium]